MAASAWLTAVQLTTGQSVPAFDGPKAEDIFKNVQVLRGIPIDEFMGTMGVFSAALGLSCEDCHAGSDKGWEAYATDTLPRKIMARRMVTMMAAINRDQFGGRQAVTCYTCHRGGDRPHVTPTVAALYGGGAPEEPFDVVRQATNAPRAERIFDRYIEALGGQARLAMITTLVGKGVAEGYGPEGERPIEVFAKAPDLRAVIVHTLDGDSTTVFDGRLAWTAAPHKPMPVLALTGGEREGLRVEAELAFPTRIAQTLSNWRVGPGSVIDDRPVDVVQGTGAVGTLVTLYFDRDSGLLRRLTRYADSRVGRLPTQIDYSDYREVSGVKVPHGWKVTWLSGLESVRLTDVRANVPIASATFARPAERAR